MNDGTYKLVLLTGLVLLATVLGVLALYSHTIMPALRKSDDTTFVRAFQAVDRQITNPIFMLQFFVPLFLLGTAAFYAQKHHLIEAKYLWAAAVCYFLAVAITVAVNVPLNDGIKKVTDTTSPESLANARAQFQEAKWTLFNHIRTVFTILSTAFTSAALWVSKVL